MERNITLDYFKVFLSVLIILLHLYSTFGTYTSLFSFGIFDGICRIAVPCFLLINGYFLFPKIFDNEKVKTVLKRLTTLCIVWSLIYLPLISYLPLNKKIFYLFMGVHHLWYFPALIAAIIFYYFLHKISRNIYLHLGLAIILFVVGYYIQYKLMFNTDYDPMNPFKFRNGIFLGLPFLIIGASMKKMECSLSKIKNRSLIPILILGLCFLALESYHCFHSLSIFDIHLSLIVLCPVSFLLVINNSVTAKSSTFKQQLSEGIFFLHPYIILLVVNGMGLNANNNVLVMLPVILFITILFSYVLTEVNKNLKIFL